MRSIDGTNPAIVAAAVVENLEEAKRLVDEAAQLTLRVREGLDTGLVYPRFGMCITYAAEALNRYLGDEEHDGTELDLAAAVKEARELRDLVDYGLRSDGDVVALADVGGGRVA